MMTLEAKTIIKNKFWIVEDQGKKIATIQAMPGGVVFVKDNQREPFPNIKNLTKRYNIQVVNETKNPRSKLKTFDVYGYPTNSRPYNQVYDLKRKLPFFTKTSKSKSLFCAGYYAILINNSWKEHFCPKSITVKRYQYLGPFKTQYQVQEALSSILQKPLNT
jgi:hypothetical protein